ncbi:hypothetical protein BC831DRAFT_440936 [Entophlyctis helioformis]|nr:hypothetical protein BC831DRAFT_440936 [Entophlyctis helioformis]
MQRNAFGIASYSDECLPTNRGSPSRQGTANANNNANASLDPKAAGVHAHGHASPPTAAGYNQSTSTTGTGRADPLRNRFAAPEAARFGSVSPSHGLSQPVGGYASYGAPYPSDAYSSNNSNNANNNAFSPMSASLGGYRNITPAYGGGGTYTGYAYSSNSAANSDGLVSEMASPTKATIIGAFSRLFKQLRDGDSATKQLSDDASSGQFGPKKRRVTDGHLAIIVILASLVTFGVVVAWFMFVWPWPFGSRLPIASVVGDGVVASGLADGVPPSASMQLADDHFGSDGSVHHSDGGHKTDGRRVPLVSVPSRSHGGIDDVAAKHLESGDVASDKTQDSAAKHSGLGIKRNRPPRQPKQVLPVDTINPRFDDIAVAVLTSRDTATSNVPIQLVTFLKQLRHMIVVGDESHAHVGSFDVDNREKKKKTASTTATEFLQSMTHWGAKPKSERAANVSSRTKAESGPGMLREASQAFNAIADLVDAFPAAQWFVVIEDDSYLFLENIKTYIEASGLDHTQHVFIGSPKRLTGCPGVRTSAIPSNTLIGSLASGLLLSRATAKSLTPAKAESCLQKFAACPSSDAIVSLCIKDATITEFTPETRLSSDTVANMTWPRNACLQPLSIPHASPRLIQRLYDAQHSTGIASDGSTVKWDAHTTYAAVMAHVYHDIGMTETDAVGTNRPGSDYMHAKAESGGQCLALCRSESRCMAWSFDQKSSTCWLKDGISPKKHKERTVSGVMASRYTCKPF